MDREHLINQLQESLAVALRLSDAGHPDETIACALGIPTQSVSVILRVATAKLDKLAQNCPQRSFRSVDETPPWSRHWKLRDTPRAGTLQQATATG
jgi:hypothetical protein